MKKGKFKSILLSLAIFCGIAGTTIITNVENTKTTENKRINVRKVDAETIKLKVTKTYTLSASDFPTVKNKRYYFPCGDMDIEVFKQYDAPLINFIEGKGATINGGTDLKVTPKNGWPVHSFTINSTTTNAYSIGSYSNIKEYDTVYNEDGTASFTIIPQNENSAFSIYLAGGSGTRTGIIGFSVSYTYDHKHEQKWYSNETHHWKECECGLPEYITPKESHTLVEDESLFIEPDHISSGTRFYSCDCGKNISEKVPPLGHTWDGTWYSNETHHWKQCSDTHETMEFDKAEHVWLFKNTVNEPTVDEIGEAIYYCESCNKEKEDLSYLNLTDEKIRIEASNLLTYTGKEQFQGVNVYYGETKLNLNEHYTLSENNQTNAGDYTLKITGKGTFRGETTFDYTIAKASLKVMVDNKVVTYGDELPSFTVSYSGFVEGENESLLTGELSFKCNYAQFSDVGEYVISVENGYDELANYNIEYIDGTLSVNPKLITLEWENTSLTYNGEGQKPVASFIGLVNGDSCDAIVSGAQTNVGTYIAIANGLTNPNYVLSSSVSTEYTIEPKSIEGAVVTLKDTLVYTGSELTQEVESVILDGVTLIKDVDYIIKNNTGINVNTYTLIVEGKGNYKGSVTKDFEIIKQKVNLPTANTNLVYTGTEVTGVSASNLYDVVDGTAVNAGSHTATVTLKDSSNYEWTEEFDGTVEYSISKAPLTITAESKEVTYGDIVPTYTVSYNGLVNNETSSVLGGTLSFVSSYSQTSNVGEYDIAASGLTSENYEITYVDGKVIVSQKEVGLTWGQTQFTYNGVSQLPTVILTGLVNNDTCEATVTGEEINAGTYEATVTALSNENYKLPINVKSEYVINKATHNMSGITFNNVTVTYNGSEHEVVLDGTLPTGVEVTYSTNKGTNVGTYNAVAKFTYDTVNYNTIADMNAVLTINKATHDMSGITFNNVTVTYNGSEHEVVLDGILPSGVEVTYTTNKGTNAGTYNAVAKFTYDTANYNVIENKTATLTINKATHNMSGVSFNDVTVTYDGKEHEVVLDGTLPTGVEVNYTTNTATKAGTYNAVATFTYDTVNYNIIADMNAVLTINKATHNMSGITFNNVTVTYNGSEHEVVLEGTLPSGVEVTYTTNKGTNAGTYNAVATFTYDTVNYNTIADMNAVLTINKATHDMSGITFNNVTVTYDGSEHEVVLEGTLPTGVEVTYTTNKGTNVGTYNAVAKFIYDTVNYNVIEDKTATLTINKAKASITVDTDDISVIYGDTITLPEGTTNFGEVVVTKVEMINVGEYKVTYGVASTNNYDGDTKEVKVIISPLAVSEPTLKGTYTYTGNEQTVELNGLESFMTIASGNKQTNAGNYEVVITLDANHVWKEGSDGKIAWSIAKATYDMSGISFNNKTVVENGENQVLTITGTLPNGVTVTYSLTECVEPGIYEITASFAGDSANYNTISPMKATLTIKQVELKFESNFEEDVIVSSPEGIDPNKELFVELVEMEESGKDFTEFLEKGERVAVAYDVKLLKDGVEVQPDGTLVIKILIPQELRNRNFNIMHIHNDTEKTILEYQIEGDYVVVETDKLSEFAFVYETGSILWLIIVLGVLALLETGLLVYLLNLRKKQKLYKVKSVYPPFVFGMFISAWQIVMVIILIIAVAVLAVIDVILVISLIKGKEKDEVKEEVKEEIKEDKKEYIEKTLEDKEDDDDDVIKVWDEEKQTYTVIRIIKSFEARLIQSNEEIKGYYDVIKNELLSYKKVKSKISFKHESFKFGKNCLAKLKYRGKTLCLYLALDPKSYENTKYKVEDMSDVLNSSDVPTMYRIHLPRRVNYAKELIRDVMNKFGIEKTEVEPINYSINYPHQTNEELIEKGLIKKLVKEIKN